MRAVVMFSGGAASYCAAERAVGRYGASQVMALFTDVKEEEPDTIRAVREGAQALGVPLVFLTHPKYRGGVWDLFEQQKVLGSGKNGVCSRILKRELARDWMGERHAGKVIQVVIGMSWEERHRTEGPVKFWGERGFHVWYPMIDEPWITKDEAIAQQSRGLGYMLRAYSEKVSEHANCRGACVKAGQAQWKQLLARRPEVYAEWERREESWRSRHGNFAILRDRRNGTTKPFPLKAFREQTEGQNLQPDLFDPLAGAGCGCFTDD